MSLILSAGEQMINGVRPLSSLVATHEVSRVRVARVERIRSDIRIGTEDGCQTLPYAELYQAGRRNNTQNGARGCVESR